MKESFWRQRLCALALALALMLALMPETGHAVLSDVYFTAVNEQLLDMASDTMPFWSGGVLYVSSRLFEGTDLGVSYVRNNAMGLVMLYTNRIDLRFDLEDQLAYDKRGNVYNGYALERSGVVFFPLDLVCRYFGLTWSYSQTDTVPLIRVKSSSGILDDVGFIDAASTQMASRYAAYEKAISTAPESGGNGPAAVQPSQPDNIQQPVQAAEGQKIFLILDSDSREAALEALQILGSIPATFLLDADEMEDGDLLRALAAGGHSAALRMKSADELERARELMWQGCCTWLDLVWDESREDTSAFLEEQGCMNVEASIDWQGFGLRNSEQANRLLLTVGQYRDDLPVYLGAAGDCASGLRPLLDALEEAGYRIAAWRTGGRS